MKVRTPLAGWDMLTLVSLGGIAIGNFWLRWLEDDKVLAATTFGIIPLVLAVLVALHIRWTPLLTTVLAFVYVLGALAGTPALDRLANPTAIWPFVATAIELLACAVAIIAGIGATIQHKRPRQPSS